MACLPRRTLICLVITSPLLVWPGDRLLAQSSPGPAASTGGEDKKNEPQQLAPRRRYKEGLIELRDYQAKPPNPLPRKNDFSLLAVTFTEICFTYQYEFFKRNGQTILRLTSTDLYADLARDHSWNASPRDQWLLDHEQGHFDLTAIHAARGQARVAKIIVQTGIVGEGADETAARDAMERQLRKAIQPVLDEWRDDQFRYDRLTNHGRNRQAQLEHRRKQQELLKWYQVTGKE